MTVSNTSLDESGSKLLKVAATLLLLDVTRGSSEAYVAATSLLLQAERDFSGLLNNASLVQKLPMHYFTG